MYSNVSLQSAPLQSSSLAASRDNGASSMMTTSSLYSSSNNNQSDRRHSRSKSNLSLSSASTSFFVGANNNSNSNSNSNSNIPSSARPRSPRPTSRSDAAQARPQTAPHRAEKRRLPDISTENYPPKFTAGTPSPGTKRQSGTGEGAEGGGQWSQSSTSSSTQRDSKRRSSFARRLSFGANGVGGGLFNGALTPSPSKRRNVNADGSRRKSPDSSPQKRRSLHSPPPPAGTLRSSAAAPLPPISTLPSLPKLSFEPLSSSTRTSSPSTSLKSPINQDFGTGDYFGTKSSTTTTTSTKRAKSPKRRRDVSLKSRLDRGLEDSGSGAEYNEPTSSAYASVSNSSNNNYNSSATISTSAFGPTDPTRHTRSGSTTRPRSISETSLGQSNTGGGGGAGSTTPSRKRDKRERDKKAMLSRALQKANTAVVLDNAQNFEGAVEAYVEACELLAQVMLNSSGEEDRKKLDGIRQTYSTRIQELYEINPALANPANRPLPPRPESGSDALGLSAEPPTSDDEEQAVIETATVTRVPNERHPSRTVQPVQASARDSRLSSAIKAVESSLKVDTSNSIYPSSSAEQAPMDKTYMPPPLTPRPAPSPTAEEFSRGTTKETQSKPAAQAAQTAHKKEGSGGSMSWLDTINESRTSSCRSSVHSRYSNGELRRKPLVGGKQRPESLGTQAEFDAALDAAVEAAYADGMEPYDGEGQALSPDDNVRTALRNVEMAKERVREAQREEAIQAAKTKERQRLLNGDARHMPYDRADVDLSPFGDDDAEEEERMLDEMTREYMLDAFDFGLQNKSALPRQSDGSESTGSTWNSSRSSNRTTGTTAATTLSSLGTVTESDSTERPMTTTSKSLTALPTLAEVNKNQSTGGVQKTLSSRPSTSGNASYLPAMPPPTTALPQVPQQQPGVRSRRMSGQNLTQLKIETSVPNKQPAQKKSADVLQSGSTASSAPLGSSKSTANQAGLATGAYQPGSETATRSTIPVPERPAPTFAASPADTTVTVSPATPGLSKAVSNDTALNSSSPGGLGKGGRLEIRKNKSSLSLHASRQISASSPDVSDAGSIATPMSTTFSTYSTRTKGSTLVNSSVMSDKTQTGLSGGTGVLSNVPMPGLVSIDTSLPSSGMNIIFDSNLHSSSQPGSPNPLAVSPPAPLEPCPCSHLLRPFWLMRCLYQTMAHPRGGYLSTKLFVPREIWKAKGVKLKAVDDKIANCDLLTAALGKLARVDMIDADAVLEEMQSLEQILDQVQSSLSKKLGSDVGVHGVGQFFKDAPVTSGEGSNASNDSTGTRTSGGDKSRSYLSSWRKLRSKNSAAGLTSLSTGGLGSKKDGSMGGSEETKNAPTMPTVPMTSLPNIRFTKRELEKADFGAGMGALSSYMESLARLCDAVQVVDTIARQVEDPGLKAASPTHVGLELCTRHASEFFGFYICRFILSDIGMMMDKFIKRSSEWVLV